MTMQLEFKEFPYRIDFFKWHENCVSFSRQDEVWPLKVVNLLCPDTERRPLLNVRRAVSSTERGK